MSQRAILQAAMKVMATEYYRRNSGFFFVLALILFGFFTADNHRMLADLAVSDIRFFLLAYGLPWLLYTVKTVNWGSQTFYEPANRWLMHHLSLIHPWRLFRIFLQIQAALLLPVLFFAGLLLRSSLHLEIPSAALIVLICVLLMLTLPPLLWISRLRIPSDIKGSSGPFRIKFLRIPAGPAFWMIRKLLQEESMLLLWSKVLGLSLLAGVSSLYYTDSYDERLILLGILAAGFSHLGICSISIDLEKELPLIRNLPFSPFRIMKLKSGFWLPVLLPEFLLLIRNCPPETGILFLAACLAFLFCLVLVLDFISGALRSKPSIREKIWPSVFFLLGFSIMFSISVAILVPVILLAAFFIKYLYFYKTDL